jgi:hypothetical protein
MDTDTGTDTDTDKDTDTCTQAAYSRCKKGGYSKNIVFRSSGVEGIASGGPDGSSFIKSDPRKLKDSLLKLRFSYGAEKDVTKYFKGRGRKLHKCSKMKVFVEKKSVWKSLTR